MSRSLLLNINLNLSKSDILINEGTTSRGNKLRTYIKLKTQFDLENYLCADVNKKYISTFVKIRISNSNLNIEKSLDFEKVP
jgi:hypothetical protein